MVTLRVVVIGLISETSSKRCWVKKTKQTPTAKQNEANSRRLQTFLSSIFSEEAAQTDAEANSILHLFTFQAKIVQAKCFSRPTEK